ncbi:MAG: hypothetical protein ABIV10_12760, partial [Gemmatimonadaceae bacterium]
MRPLPLRLLAAALCLTAFAVRAHAQNTVVLEGIVRTAAGPLGGGPPARRSRSRDRAGRRTGDMPRPAR